MGIFETDSPHFAHLNGRKVEVLGPTELFLGVEDMLRIRFENGLEMSALWDEIKVPG